MEHDPSVEDMPVRGEPLAVDLVNTTFMVDGTRGHVVDVLASPGMLLEWLSSRSDDMGSQLVEQLAQAGINGEAVRRFQALRAALRELLAAETGHAPWPLDAVEAVNLAARGAAWWEEFSAAAPGEAVDVWSTSDWVAASLARVARSGVSILSGRQRALIRACSAPGCILFFVQSHLRRKWCSAKCGNRARVSRHNRRRRSGQLRGTWDERSGRSWPSRAGLPRRRCPGQAVACALPGTQRAARRTLPDTVRGGRALIAMDRGRSSGASRVAQCAMIARTVAVSSGLPGGGSLSADTPSHGVIGVNFGAALLKVAYSYMNRDISGLSGVSWYIGADSEERAGPDRGLPPAQ